MKTKLILCLLLLAATLLGAQLLNPYQNMVHSSRCADGNLRLRWQDPTGLGMDTQCWYNAGGNGWQQAPTGVYSDVQMQALLPYEFGQNLRYRLRTELVLMEENLVYMHTPYLGSELFPPSVSNLGQIGTDAVGDSVTTYAPNLDLTESWFGATPTKLYSALANVPNSFPTLNSVFSYNVYMTTLSNPDTVVDTLSYAMIYSFYIADVIQPGLYKLRLGDAGLPSFTRIGNIQTMVLGGKLYMACDLADLTNDPDFGAWPNSVNALVAASLTMKLSIDPNTYALDYGIGDYSTPGILFFEDHSYQVAENTLPQCSNYWFDLMSHTFSFDYYDAEGDFPLQMELVLPDLQVLEPLPLSHDFSQPVSYSVQLPGIPDFATLRWSDNAIDIPEYLHWFVGTDDDLLPAAELSCRLPNPLRCGDPFTISLAGLSRETLSVRVYNLRGQKLGTLYEGSVAQAGLDLPWNGTLNGTGLDSGVYFLRIAQGGRLAVQRFVITK
ncbi:MAG TPA: T9SS type A sorting domain-containing protein [Candidatus Syntrophosphaera sp.]|jgi:hypothetical protein|nr:T9SS type A sorting domain-containing protein [Candidatus Syntrophosphaera sp.]HPH60090.1 T9SS type A sorting domain-containing protein [Candidatus Syntrophosphaera sp.]